MANALTPIAEAALVLSNAKPVIAPLKMIVLHLHRIAAEDAVWQALMPLIAIKMKKEALLMASLIILAWFLGTWTPYAPLYAVNLCVNPLLEKLQRNWQAHLEQETLHYYQSQHWCATVKTYQAYIAIRNLNRKR